MDAYGIRKGINRLMQTLPVTEDGLRTAYALLLAVDTVHSFDEDPTPVFERWATVQPSDNFKKYHDGDAPGLDMKEEFLCLLGALYGHYSIKLPDGKWDLKYVGSFDSPKRYLRCAFYGREQPRKHKTKPEDMDKYYSRDEDAYTIAAFYNDRLFWDDKCRARLEHFMRGRLIYRYKRRCEQLHAKYPNFKLKPVSEDGIALLEDENGQPDEAEKRMEHLEALVAANGKQLNDISKRLMWVFILVVAALLLIWRPHI